MMGTPTKTDILITDDRPDSLIALEALLDLPNYNLVKASSGRQAIEQLKSFDFAVILMDVQMPEMDGFQTVSKIKEMPASRHIPVIFITAIDKDERYVTRGYESGAVDYVFKPFDAHILKSKVAVFVELHEKNRLLLEQSRQLQEHERVRRVQELAQRDLENLLRYSNLANAIPHIVWRADTSGHVDYLNQEWVQCTGRQTTESLGDRWLSSFHPDDIRLASALWRSSFKDNSPFEIEVRLADAQGNYRFHLLKATPEKDSSGQNIGWLGTCTDIEERKRIVDELANAKVMAEAANVAKTNFLANMSHEIRTPLNAVLGFTDLLLNADCAIEDRRSWLATIRRNGELLLNIIDEVLDLSKIEAGHLQIERTEVDLKKLFADLQHLLRLRANEKGLTLLFQFSAEVPRYVIADPTRLKQILINVVSNSIKFTLQGSVEVEIHYEKEHLNLRVTDTGIGIDPSKAHLLFHPFMQIDNSKTREFGGSGLGLALSRRLARALGGDIELIASKVNAGAEFRISILAPTKLNSPALHASNIPNTFVSESSSPRDSSQLNEVKILLVEDSKDNQDLLSRFLNLAGAQVEVAQDGQEGFEKAITGEHDIVLMDIQMPRLDGYSATAKLRKLGFAKPIIALTAHALKEEKTKCLSAGCNDYLSKPIDRLELINRVAESLRLRETLNSASVEL